MTSAVFALIVNTVVCLLFAATFVVMATSNRSFQRVAWFALAYMVGACTPASEFLVRFTGSDLFVEKVQDGFFLMNARIGLRGPDQNWSLEVWAQNLLNTDYQQVAFNAPFQGAGSQSQVQKFGSPSYAVGNQIFSAFLAEPRTYGVTLRKRF